MTYPELIRLDQKRVPFLLSSCDAGVFFQESQGLLPIFDDPKGLFGSGDGGDGRVGRHFRMMVVVVVVTGKDRRSGADDYSAFL